MPLRATFDPAGVVMDIRFSFAVRNARARSRKNGSISIPRPLSQSLDGRFIITVLESPNDSAAAPLGKPVSCTPNHPLTGRLQAACDGFNVRVIFLASNLKHDSRGNRVREILFISAPL